MIDDRCQVNVRVIKEDTSKVNGNMALIKKNL